MEHITDSTLDTVSAQATANELAHITTLARYVKASGYRPAAVAVKATEYIEHVRNETQPEGMEVFFREYGFSTKEGMAIMRLAEALLRIPDKASIHALLHDTLTQTQWQSHIGRHKSLFVNSSAVGLHVAQHLFGLGDLVQKLADPMVREAVKYTIGYMGDYFVLGQTPQKALARSQAYQEKGYCFSYDQLGEGARSQASAEAYFAHYLALLDAVSQETNASISVKLSALCPRLEWLRRDDVIRTLLPMFRSLIEKAKIRDTRITLDAEETARHDLLLYVFETLLSDPVCHGYQGLGIAVQAYHKQAFDTISWLVVQARKRGITIPVRLVKGAYWDSEIKQAQLDGLVNYPVFTHKAYTDISYLACAVKMLEHPEEIYPQFATHNAYTIAAIEQLAEGKTMEFQRLFGMGEGLYDYIVGQHTCRIYAPIGNYTELLPYLIRRLIENSANNAFVKALSDDTISVHTLVRDPLEALEPKGLSMLGKDIPLPQHIIRTRERAGGIAFGNRVQVSGLEQAVSAYHQTVYERCSMINGKSVQNLSPQDYPELVKSAVKGGHAWSQVPVDERCKLVHQLARELEIHQHELMHLLMTEAKKTIKDATSEVREAIDYCRYYALQATQIMALPGIALSSPTGETNCLTLHPRGVFVCISPWNFPLAIFMGQIIAALVTGNSVIAKPAEATSQIAVYLVRLMHQVGIPASVLQLVTASGSEISQWLLSAPEIAGVVFTGSTRTAQSIHQLLAQRGGTIPTLIAETGGINAMIIDSTALIEQAVDDVIVSAFGSAGQRCSSCRVVYIQEEIADQFIALLGGAMQHLKVGSPEAFDTDVGPVINQAAYDTLSQYIQTMKAKTVLLAHTPLAGAQPQAGHFIAPHLFAIDSLRDLPEEVFGPILHVIRYRSDRLGDVIDQINASGYGLTLGIHSRIQQRCEWIRQQVRVGNIYVNRSMIGAVVGVQPFGGEGLSGTGFKAGGPHYLLKFVTERVYTVNTAAIGGNQELLG